MTVLSLQIVCVTSWAWSNLRTSGETQLGPLIPQPIKGSGFPIGLGRLLDQALNFECLFVWWVCKMLRSWDTIKAQCWKWGQALTQSVLVSSLQKCFCHHKSLSDFCGNWLMLMAWFLFPMITTLSYAVALLIPARRWCWGFPLLKNLSPLPSFPDPNLLVTFFFLEIMSSVYYNALICKIMWIIVWLNIFLFKKKNLVTFFPRKDTFQALQSQNY